MIRDRTLCVSILFADETTFFAQTQLHKALIPDDDALQSQQLVPIEWCPPCLADGTSPSLNAVLARSSAAPLAQRLQIVSIWTISQSDNGAEAC